MLLNNSTISFSGVDGAGKTTILTLVKDSLLARGLKVVELRSRPSVLPILSAFKYGKVRAEHAASVALPRQGENTSKIGSYLRFGYYLTDYIVGQVYIYFKYTRRGYFIVYDRFYYDYIVDPKRANLVIHKSVARFFLRFIREPDLNVFLYAPAEIILERKRELDSETIRFLTAQYLSLFSDLEANSKTTYLCIENIDLSDTLCEIESYLDGVGT
jgi:thymidylate kinase